MNKIIYMIIIIREHAPRIMGWFEKLEDAISFVENNELDLSENLEDSEYVVIENSCEGVEKFGGVQLFFEYRNNKFEQIPVPNEFKGTIGFWSY